MMAPLWIMLAFTVAATFNHAESQSLDSLIDEVFKKPKQNETKGGYSSSPSSTTSTTTIRTNINEEPPRSNQEPMDCECVPYYLCQNDSIITDGVGLIDIRSAFPRSVNDPPGMTEGPCDNYLDVCCKKPNSKEDPITPKPHEQRGCGFRNPNGVGFRITGDKDNEAQFAEFPWMVAVLKEETVDGNPEKLNVYQCGGSLIHPQVVLTAAHCVFGKKGNFKIRAGEWDTQTKSETYPHQDQIVKEVVVHENFNPNSLYNDVALLILADPVQLTENVDVVCLPAQEEIIDNSKCYASGWGKNVFGKDGQYQVILKKVELPTVPFEDCQKALRKTRLGSYFQLHPTFMCAGGAAGQDTCKGDGGSPLVCPLPNDPTRYQQAGIVAWGIGCGEDGTPGVYVNVPQFRFWIDEQMAYYRFDTNKYIP